MNWPCQFIATATMPDKRTRTISFIFEGNGDINKYGLIAFFKRSKKPWLWYGVEYFIYTPLGQCSSGVIERE